MVGRLGLNLAYEDVLGVVELVLMERVALNCRTDAVGRGTRLAWRLGSV